MASGCRSGWKKVIWETEGLWEIWELSCDKRRQSDYQNKSPHSKTWTLLCLSVLLKPTSVDFLSGASTSVNTEFCFLFVSESQSCNNWRDVRAPRVVSALMCSHAALGFSLRWCSCDWNCCFVPRFAFSIKVALRLRRGCPLNVTFPQLPPAVRF